MEKQVQKLVAKHRQRKSKKEKSPSWSLSEEEEEVIKTSKKKSKNIEMRPTKPPKRRTSVSVSPPIERFTKDYSSFDSDSSMDSNEERGPRTKKKLKHRGGVRGGSEALKNDFIEANRKAFDEKPLPRGRRPDNDKQMNQRMSRDNSNFDVDRRREEFVYTRKRGDSFSRDEPPYDEPMDDRHPRDIDDRHREMDDRHRDIPDRHRDIDDRHREMDDRHPRDLEREIVERHRSPIHRDLDDRHRSPIHREMDDRHRDMDDRHPRDLDRDIVERHRSPIHRDIDDRHRSPIHRDLDIDDRVRDLDDRGRVLDDRVRDIDDRHRDPRYERGRVVDDGYDPIWHQNQYEEHGPPPVKGGPRYDQGKRGRMNNRYDNRFEPRDGNPEPPPYRDER